MTAALLMGLTLVAFTMRAPIAALSPVVPLITDDLALTATEIGLLTSVPLLCFALLAHAGSAVIDRVGPYRALGYALAGILVGQLVRSAGGFAVALGGALLIGAGIAVGNTAIPTVITRDFPSRSTTLMAAYSATMNVGASLATVAAVPLAALMGWRWALASFGTLTVVAAAWWGLATRGRGTAPPPVTQLTRPGLPVPSRHTAPQRSPMARRELIAMAGVFAVQSSSVYALMAWLPTIVADQLGVDAATAGGIVAPFAFMAILGALGLPLLIRRGVTWRWTSFGVAVTWLALPLGVVLEPTLTVLWASLAGAAQGANFATILTLVNQRSGCATQGRRAWTAVQTVGYSAAALAPTLMGALFEITGGWTVPLITVAALLTAMGIALQAVLRRPAPRPPHPGESAEEDLRAEQRPRLEPVVGHAADADRGDVRAEQVVGMAG